MAKAYYVRGFRNKSLDLFGNPVGSLASLAVFRLSAYKTAVYITNQEFGIHPENVYFILGFDLLILF